MKLDKVIAEVDPVFKDQSLESLVGPVIRIYYDLRYRGQYGRTDLTRLTIDKYIGGSCLVIDDLIECFINEEAFRYDEINKCEPFGLFDLLEESAFLFRLIVVI